VRRYFLRKLFVYALTFVVAVTIDWAIPHLMPGNPVLTLMGRLQIQDPKVAQQVYDHYMRAFNLNLPLWKQYYFFWVSLIHGDLGRASCSSRRRWCRSSCTRFRTRWGC